MLDKLCCFEIGNPNNKMSSEIMLRDRVEYVSCNTNPHARPGKIIYRASMKGDKCKIVLYTYWGWEKTLYGLFEKNSKGDWTWEKVDGLGNENAYGVVKLVNSVEEAKKALQCLYATFDKRLRDEAQQGA